MLVEGMYTHTFIFSPRPAETMSFKNAQAYQFIRTKLFDGTYAFGAPISVKELSEETGISRQPIMTALYRLQEHGFVDIAPQVGCYVVQPALQEIMDFYQMFAAIEAVIAHLAAERADEEGLNKLREINQKIMQLKPDSKGVEKAYRQFNVEFHLQLQHLAQSPWVCLRQQANFDLSDFYLTQTKGFKQNLDFAGVEHEQLISAVEQRNPSLASQLAQAHIMNVAQHIKRHW